MSCFSKFLVAAGLLQSAFASPTLIHVPAQRAAHLQERQTSDAALLNSLVNIITKADPAAGLSLSGLVTDILGGIGDDLHEANLIFSALLTAIEDTVAAQVTATPTDIPAASSALSSILAATPTILYEQIFEVIENGLVTDKLASEVNALVTASFSGMNSKTNVNPAPTCTIYPQKNCTDAPYNLTEDQLRQVIYIPATFTYGKVPPVILVPGTGNTGYQTFAGNYIPLLQGSTIADPVWLNIPGQLLMDVQVNAEYVAYAINYISCITNKNVSVISWSQGGLDTQWALKYWPSTRQVTSDFIPMSPDFHGTVLAYILCPAFPMLPCAPAVIQQEYNSNFIATIRNNGGNSAYVPTTTVFSSTDEIVQPQSPVTGASAFLLDARNVGVTNNQVQAVCGGRGPAGTFYTHEGVLYNPLGYALVIDALTHAGPGRTSRIDLTTVCAQIVSPGLDLIDVLTTEESIVLAGLSVVLYPAKQINEPAIMSYAVAGATVGANCTTSSTSGSASRTTSTSSGRSTVLTVSVDVTVTSTQRTSSTSSSTTSSSRSTSTKSTVAASASAVIVLPFSSPVMKTIAGSRSMTIVVLPTTPVIKARETTVLECDGAECGSTAHQAAVTSHSAMTSNTESYENTVNETTTVLAFSTPAVPSHWHGHHSNFTKTPKLGGHSIKNGAPRKPENTIPSFSESTASFTFASSAPATTAAPEVVYSSTGYRVNEDGSYDFGNENEKLDSGVEVQYVTHTVLVDA